MASRDDVLKHVEQIAYLAALAGLTANAIAETVDVTDLPDAREHDVLLLALTTALTDKILPEVQSAARAYAATLGYGILSAFEEKQVSEQAIHDAIADATPRIDAALTDIENKIEGMTNDGVAPETIQKTASSDAGSVALFAGIAAIMKQTGTGIVNSISNGTLEAAQAKREIEAAAAGEEPVQWDWITMGDDSVCSEDFETSCEPRHGQTDTLDGWASVGMPRAGNLICSIYSRSGGSNCRCFLKEQGTFLGLSDGPVSVGEALARGKAKAELEFEAQQAEAA